MTTIRVVHTPEGVDDQEAQTHVQPTPGEQTRVIGGAHRITVGQENAEEHGGVSRHTVTHSGIQGGSVLATIRRDGPTQSVELIPGNPASRTDVRVALREGLLRLNDAGQLEDAAGQQDLVQQVGQEPQQQRRADPGAEVFDAKLDQMFAAEIEPLPQPAYDTTVARMVAHIAHGTGSVQDMAKALARDAGMEPAAAEELIRNGVWVHQQAVEKALAPMGITGERLQAFYAECKARPGLLQNAIQELVHARNPAAFVKLAQELEAANPGPDVELLSKIVGKA